MKYNIYSGVSGKKVKYMFTDDFSSFKSALEAAKELAIFKYNTPGENNSCPKYQEVLEELVAEYLFNEGRSSEYEDVEFFIYNEMTDRQEEKFIEIFEDIRETYLLYYAELCQ